MKKLLLTTLSLSVFMSAWSYAGANTLADITVTATGGVLTCSATSVTLDAITDASNPVYSWTGPNGYVSNMKNPGATVPGAYTVTVTAGDGQTATATALVTQNIAQPGAIATASGAITCIQPAVVLTGSSFTPGSLYRWTGPMGFTSTQQNVVVSIAGTYALVVTNPVNGCSSTAMVLVTQNIAPPGAIAIASGTLNCTQTSVALTGVSSTPNVTYRWTGPNGFSSTFPNVVVSVPGSYTLRVTNPLNGCFSVGTTNVTQNIEAPGAEAAVSGVLTCTQLFVTLLGTSPTQGALYHWTGPDGFNSTEQNPEVSLPGNYILVVTSPWNGCSSLAAVEVTSDPDCFSARTAIADTEAGAVLYPNPVVDHGTIQFVAPENGHVKVEIYTTLNVRKATLFEGDVNKGSIHAINLETAGYDKGVYLYQITGAGISKQGRLYVSH